MKISVCDNEMRVCGLPYSDEFRRRCGGMGGHAEQVKGRPGCAWVFPAENEYRVREALLECFGENGLPQDTVTVLIEPARYMSRDSEFLMLGSITAARKRGRDGGTAYHKDVFLIAGTAYEKGGSKQHPLLNFSEDAVLRYDGYPEALIDRVDGMPGITVKKEEKG